MQDLEGEGGGPTSRAPERALVVVVDWWPPRAGRGRRAARRGALRKALLAAGARAADIVVRIGSKTVEAAGVGEASDAGNGKEAAVAL